MGIGFGVDSSTARRTEKPRGPARVLPFLDWARHYDRSWGRGDLVAGLAVAALVVPKSLGYAGIARVPIQHGLYAAAAGTILYGLFGTSRQISTGPSSALAAVAGSAVALEAAGDVDPVALVAAVTMVTGLLFLLLAIFRMGWISNFLSKAVITGFLFGAAIDVVIGELGKLTGTSVDGTNAWREFGSWVSGLATLHVPTLVVGVVSLALILGIRFSPIRVPGALVLVIAGLVASAAFDFEASGIALVGDVPRGLPVPRMPGPTFVVTHITTIAPAALGLLLIGFSQTAADARSFAARHGYRIDIDQESVAQGVSNVGSAVLQGIPVSTSLSASSLNDQTGARTPAASLVTGALIVLTLLVLAPLFSGLPQAVLAALIIDAVVFGMMDVAEMRRLRRVARVDYLIAIAAIIAVLSAGVLAGVMIGVALSLGWLIHINASPPMPVLGLVPGTQAFRSSEEYPDIETHPGLLVIRFDAGLFFASAEALEDRLRELAQDAETAYETIVLSCEGIDFIDSQGSGKLADILQLAATYGADIHLARVKPHVLDLLRRDGVIETLGEDHVHANVYEAAKHALAAPPPP